MRVTSKERVSINYSGFRIPAYCMRYRDNNSLFSLYFCIMLMIIKTATCQEGYPAFYYCLRYLHSNPEYLCLNTNPRRHSNESTLSLETLLVPVSGFSCCGAVRLVPVLQQVLLEVSLQCFVSSLDIALALIQWDWENTLKLGTDWW